MVRIRFPPAVSPCLPGIFSSTSTSRHFPRGGPAPSSSAPMRAVDLSGPPLTGIRSPGFVPLRSRFRLAPRRNASIYGANGPGEATWRQPTHRHRLLLRAQRPRRRHLTTQQEHQLAPSHSMTSSARPIDGGTVRPTGHRITFPPAAGGSPSANAAAKFKVHQPGPRCRRSYGTPQFAR